MKYLLLSLLIFGFGISGSLGQTIKSLGYNTTNGQVVANTGTNTLRFTNNVSFQGGPLISGNGVFYGTNEDSGLHLADRELYAQGQSIFAYTTNSIEFYVELGFSTTNVAATTRANLGFSTNLNTLWTATNASNARSAVGLGWSALTNTNSATSLLGFTTNGEVVYTNTNALTFTNRFGQSSTNATNPPEIRLTTKSNNVASLFYYDAALSQTNPAAPDWSGLWLGNNHVTSANGRDRGRARQDIGAVSLTMENHWVTPVKTSPVSEVYFNTEDTNGLTTRSFFIMGSQTNSAIGGIEMKYPITHTVNSNSIYWYGGNPQAAYTIFTDQEFLINARATAPAAMGRITFGTTDNGITALLSGEGLSYARHWALGRSIYRMDANGIVFGSENANLAAAAPVHLAGNTRIDGAISFNATSNAATTRTNLGLGLPALTNTNVTNFLEAIGLGTTNTVTFSNLVINGNFTNNGTIYGLKTNVGPFEGIGNFFASNNTAVGNETLFRVGVAETTNKSAQFGFRVARTNNGGEGLAVFSVFGYNALMMIGPSDRSRSNSLTNTNAAIEADIWTMSETNRVMTLRDTNTGATVMHRPIGFNTNEVSTTAPSNTIVTNPTGWIQIYVGTNSVRVPYYQ